MSSKRIYRRVSVKEIKAATLLGIVQLKRDVGCTVGLDVAKEEIVVVIRWGDGSFERPWSVKNPIEIGVLIELLCLLRDHVPRLIIGLESTGTYGEAVRYALTAASLEVHRVSGKAVSDYKEIFDGVPSQHDGKDAAMIAELVNFGKGTPWPFEARSETDQEIKHQVARLSAFIDQANQWTGRLEGVLARHWPELTSLLKLSSATLRQICVHYGSPAKLVEDKSAATNLRRWGGPGLKPEKITQIIESAGATCGIPMGISEMVWLQEIAEQLTFALDEIRKCEKKLAEIVHADEVMRSLAGNIGAVTVSVIWATVGDPRQYTSSGAFLKALGLNLKELSSGKRKGELAITKRGPSRARKMLFFWALRAVQKPQLEGWYKTFQRVGRNRKGVGKHRKMKGLVAMMRKLCRSLWYVRKHDLEFDYGKVFPGQPLQKRQRRRRQRRRPQLASS